MPSLVVGGTTIPVARSSPSWGELDAVDRARAFDNTYRASQTGGSAREWTFSTPPVSAALGATYKARLRSIAPQLCSGDILELPTMCGAELLGGTPIRASGGFYEIVNFKLHEAQSARALFRFTAGDLVAGESFSRATAARYVDVNGILQSAAINVKRDSHYTAISGTRSILLEGPATNFIIRSEEFDNAAWTKDGVTVVADNAAGPAGAVTADRIVETATTAEHRIYQMTATTLSDVSWSVFAKAQERSWLAIRSTTGTFVVNYDLSNGVLGSTNTNGSTSGGRITAMTNGWYRCQMWALTLAPNEFLTLNIGAADTGVGVGGTAYLGDVTKGLLLWGGQVEQTAR